MGRSQLFNLVHATQKEGWRKAMLKVDWSSSILRVTGSLPYYLYVANPRYIQVRITYVLEVQGI